MHYLKLSAAVPPVGASTPAPQATPTATPQGSPSTTVVQHGAGLPKLPQAAQVQAPMYGGSQPLQRAVPHNGQLLQPAAMEMAKMQEAEAAAQAEKDKPKEKAPVKSETDGYGAAHAASRISSMASRLKMSTDSAFLREFNGPNAGSYNPSFPAPSVPDGNLFDAKKWPLPASIYASLRPMLLKPLTSRYQYGGFQGDLASKAWHPFVQRQLMAGPDRYQKSPGDLLRGSGLSGLLSQALPAIQGMASKFMS